ncbi:anti-sigma factor [Paenibacillus typhae]|uniref:Anti-sigma-W factor RsiW n=1 Tax=Paenibacillus typhae TaxID=1174501 RepID=A0A1G8I4T7_9BACL|nr:anti-sigma factor [Paenibacillus typhae]SDI13844.1 Putative zinc-finger [Paenibacillus typhae]
MKCTEVTEWMHRYLDHDLSPEETVEMYRHIDNCPSCAEVFDRLTMLSEQLEQLPDVKPPFSLVDSILPQLEQIDSGIRGSDAEVPEQDSKVVPMTRKGTHGKEAKGTSRAASMATRTGIGAVAAAVILLFAVFNMPERLPSADVEMSLNQAAETAGSNEAMSKMATENTDTGAAGDEAGDASLYQMEIQPSEGADAASDGAAADTAAPSAVEAAPTAQSGAAAPAATEPSSAKRNTPAARSTQAATPAPRDNARAGSGNTNSASDAQIFNSSAADMPAGTADTSAKEPQQPPASQEAGIMGLLPALVSSHGSWSSPDGRYAAELAGQQLVIYSLPADGQPEERTAVTSLPLEGTWVSGSWSGDSLQFTYITMQDGVEVTEVYTAPASQATPAPSASPGSPATVTPAPASTAPANK